MQQIKPSKLEQCWQPGPPQRVRFNTQEMHQIHFVTRQQELQQQLAKRFPGWTIHQCGSAMNPGLKEAIRGKKNVFVSHPLSRSVPCVLSRKITVGTHGATLRLVVGHHPDGDWRLRVMVDGKRVAQQIIGPETCESSWTEVMVDLPATAGKTVDVQLVNEATGWRYEAAYWAEIDVESSTSEAGK